MASAVACSTGGGGEWKVRKSKAMVYAQRTFVSTEKSRAEIERTLARYGATAFDYGWASNRATVGFELQGRRIRFLLPLPDAAERRFTHSARGVRSREKALEAWEQACRERWRALALVIKAKLEAVASDITTLEDEFLAHIVLPDGRTVGEWAKPQVAIAYERGEMPPLLPAGAQ
jgi:hypothetical protein